jgi:hypothetical protein
MKALGKKPADAGQATIMLMLMIVVGLVALTIMFVRVGHADFMRSNAKEAADAAALAGASAVRDRSIASLERLAIPGPLFPDDSSRAAADKYAQINSARLTKYEGGIFSSDVMVTVASDDCVYKNQEPFQQTKQCPRNPDDQTKKLLKHASATSVATVEYPLCSPVYSRWHGYVIDLICDGKHVAGIRGDFPALASLFNVHLKDSFNKGDISSLGGGGTKDLPPPTSGHAPQNMQMAKTMMQKQYGWDDNQYQCLVQLWTHESDWNETARNPGPGHAYGIPQALPPGKMGSAALSPNWPGNAQAQINWGLNYINSVYSTPCAAWTFWQHPTRPPYNSNWY